MPAVEKAATPRNRQTELAMSAKSVSRKIQSAVKEALDVSGIECDTIKFSMDKSPVDGANSIIVRFTDLNEDADWDSFQDNLAESEAGELVEFVLPPSSKSKGALILRMIDTEGASVKTIAELASKARLEIAAVGDYKNPAFLKAAVTAVKKIMTKAGVVKFFNYADAKWTKKNVHDEIDLFLPFSSTHPSKEERKKIALAIGTDRPEYGKKDFNYKGTTWEVGDGDDVDMATTFTKTGAEIWIRNFDDDEEPQESSDAREQAYAKKVALALAKKTGVPVTADDYLTWYEGDGKGSIARMDKAVNKLVGKEARDVAENLARLDSLVDYALGLGSDKIVGGISMQMILDNHKKKPAAQQANKAKLREVNAAIKKLTAQKGVQQYIKLAKIRSKLKA